MVFRRLPRGARLLFLIVSAGLSLKSTLAHAQGTNGSTAQNQGQNPSPGASQGPGSPAPGGGAGTDARDNLIPQEPTAPPTQASPANDQQRAQQQARERPTQDGTIGERPTDVFSEDWWSHTRPIVELHGYFRTRGELFHNFSLGRHTAEDNSPGYEHLYWPQPLDHTFTDLNGQRRLVLLCGDKNAAGAYGECLDKTQATANMRLRLNPEIHISDNLRILSQVDLLGNLVLGSTPDVGNGNQYAPISAMATSQSPPTSGVNGFRNSVDVQRAWAEYVTPIGQLRFGRMPNHWGLGMLYNAGDQIDQDWQTNIDRIMFVTGLKSLDLYVGGAWDFIGSGPLTGPTNTQASLQGSVNGGQAYNNSNIANVDQWTAFIAKRTNPDVQRLKLARGEAVLNGGIYAVYRKQDIDVANETTGAKRTAATGSPPGATATEVLPTSDLNNGFTRRNAQQFVPDIWVQFLWSKLRLEAEAASIWGSVESSPLNQDPNQRMQIRMFGFAAQSEYRAIEDKLRIGFGAGWASGDPSVEGLTPPPNGIQPRLTGGAMSTFRFNPAYNIDLIFFRRILTRVEGAYYFRPNVEYDFVRKPDGQKFGGGATIIYSRASEFMQTPGNKRDLGLEIDAQLYYQSKDGSLNDDPNKMGGFFAALQYGVFFPFGGLEYLPRQQTNTNPDWSLSSAQTVRLILGVLF